MARRIAVEAGQRLFDYAERAAGVAYETKPDGSPVTHIEREVEGFITDSLAALVEGIPVVAEEAVAEGRAPALQGVSCYWLVDPLDGTRSYVADGDEYAVNIALIRDGVPVLGVIYNPVKGEAYSGCGPDTAVRFTDADGQEKSVRVRRPPAAGLVVTTSRTGGDKALERFLENYKVAKIVRTSSALKFCMVAAGKADMYPRFGPAGLWDIAAGDAVLRAAGASVNDLRGVPLVYDAQKGGFESPPFVACMPELLQIPED